MALFTEKEKVRLGNLKYEKCDNMHNVNVKFLCSEKVDYLLARFYSASISAKSKRNKDRVVKTGPCRPSYTVYRCSFVTR
jgi:hypothetical protein